MRLLHLLRPLAPSAATALLGGCATIMHGPRQDVGISSTPTNARITIDNQQHGVTPMVAPLRRKDNHVVRIELDGYQPYETTLTRRTSGWVWGNLVFGGLPGLAVDAITGGLYKLSPEQIQGQLAGAGSGSRAAPGSDGLYVVLVRRADPAWAKVGQLRR